jgi:hypothetical protein
VARLQLEVVRRFLFDEDEIFNDMVFSWKVDQFAYENKYSNLSSFGYANNPLILIDGLEVTTNDLARIEPCFYYDYLI